MHDSTHTYYQSQQVVLPIKNKGFTHRHQAAIAGIAAAVAAGATL